MTKERLSVCLSVLSSDWLPGLAVDKRQRKAWYLFPRTVRGWKDSLFLFFYRFHSSFPPSPLLFLNLHPSPHYLYVSALSVYFYVSTLLSSSSFFLLLPIDFLVFSRWQIGVLLNINLCSCCVYEHGRGGCVGNGRAFLSLRLAERWSFIRRGLLWLVCVGRYGEHTEENEPADPNTHKHATVYTHLELLRHTHRLILLSLPLQHLASTPFMHHREVRPKQPLRTVYHLYYFITFLRVFPNLILLHCHQMMSSLICSLPSFLLALPQIYRPW